MTVGIRTITVPRIGEYWDGQGGIYAGIVAGENGEPDYHLIHALDEHEITDVNYQEAIKAAKAEINGFSDWCLPTYRDSLLLAINCQYRFDWDDGYWTSTKWTVDNTVYAFVQYFVTRSQEVSHWSYTHRVCAVRKVFIV